ncbi:MAG TPA: hypothetical protein VGD56_09565 [Gemmatirosa sp.]
MPRRYAAKENANSRVYIGYQFRYATEVGLVVVYRTTVRRPRDFRR